MRITRSTLRRIIAEESARILAETKKHGHRGKRSGEPSEDRDEDQEQSDMDTFMDTGEDPFPFGEPAEDEDEDDYNYGDDPDEFLDLPAGEIQRRLRDLDESEGKKRHQSPRDRLAAYLDRVGADSAAIMRAVDRAVDRAHEEGSEVTSEDITFNLSDEVLDAIPEDDSDRWHSMLDAVLADEIDPDAFADAEADRRDIRDTERSLDREEGLSDYGDEGEDDYDDGGDWYLEEGDGGDYDYEDEPEGAEMGDPEDPYGDLPKGEHPRGGLVHTAGFKGDSPAGALLRRREEFPEHPSGLTGMGGPYSEYDHLHYGAGINEARWAKLAGVLKD
jgi:hypothetical protein